MQALYRVEDSVTLTANPSTGYTFENWTGDIGGIADPSQPTVTFVMGVNRTITANFAPPAERYVVTMTTSPDGGGSVALDPDQTDYSLNQTVSAVASPSTGYVFSQWSGDLSGTDSTTSLVVDDNKSITAVFNPTLTIQNTPDTGTVEATPTLTSGGYPVGTVVSLNAKPALGYVFEGWTGDTAGMSDVSSAGVSVTMDAPRTLTANFVASPPLKVTASTEHEASGSVTVEPAEPPEGYAASQEIKVYALPSPGYVFSHWAGDVSGSDPVLTIAVDSEKEITAVFDPTVTIENDPTSGGTVEVTTPEASGGYPVGTEVTVEAVAGNGYSFESWEGDVTGSENPATVVMDSPKTMTALFVKEAQFPWGWIVVGIAGVIAVVAVIRLVYVRMNKSKTQE